MSKNPVGNGELTPNDTKCKECNGKGGFDLINGKEVPSIAWCIDMSHGRMCPDCSGTGTSKPFIERNCKTCSLDCPNWGSEKLGCATWRGTSKHLNAEKGERLVYQCPRCATSMEVDPSAKPSAEKCRYSECPDDCTHEEEVGCEEKDIHKIDFHKTKYDEAEHKCPKCGITQPDDWCGGCGIVISTGKPSAVGEWPKKRPEHKEDGMAEDYYWDGYNKAIDDCLLAHTAIVAQIAEQREHELSEKNREIVSLKEKLALESK